LGKYGPALSTETVITANYIIVIMMIILMGTVFPLEGVLL
jgi:hypothetical protein